MKYMDLLNTDPLAIGALVGLAAVLVVTLGVFAFLLGHKDKRKS